VLNIFNKYKKLEKKIVLWEKVYIMKNKTERSVCIRRIGSTKVQPPEGNNIYYSFYTQTQA